MQSESDVPVVKSESYSRDQPRFLEEAIPHMSALYRVSLSMSRSPSLAEDLVQETYKEAWKSFHRYRPRSNCKGWLFRILFRIWNRHLRKTNRIIQIDLDEVSPERLALQPDSQQGIEREEVFRILQTLPEHYQRVLLLADVEELRYREIAEVLELPIGTVMSRLNRARSLFRKKFLQQSETSRWESA